MQALVEEIAALVQKIKEGTATLGELEAFAAATNTLNERAIILRHKAYEAKVYGVSRRGGLDNRNSTPLSDQGDSIEEDTSTTLSGHEEVATVEAQEPIEMETESAEMEEDISFDLFSMDDDVSTPFDSAQGEPIEVIEEQTIEEPISDSAQSESYDDRTTVEFDQEEDPMLQPLGEEASILEAEPEIIEEKIAVAQQPITITHTDEHPVVRKALTNDGTLQARLLTVRLETLKSAFGLNERIQIVQELFKGSNEAYTTAIEQLDTQSDKSNARSLVNSLAHTYSWNVDSEVALEFVQKVERRYA